jgi:predicted dienelactone hydrolase
MFEFATLCRRSIRSLALGLVSFWAMAGQAQTIVPPLRVTGPNPVGCSNVEQDFSRVPTGETAEMYWRGVASGGIERYVTTLFVAPASALVTTFTAPADPDLYDRWAGQPVTYAFLVCYPTTTANTRGNYPLPGGDSVPKMQRGGEAPILPASPARLPVLAFSHGYGGSPLTSSYLRSLVAFASWGYVTIAPFHGDLRYSVFGPEDVSRVDSRYIPVWSEFVAMQATRPLSVSAGLELLSNHTQWRDRIDAGRIGAFGISQGGETVLLLGGAKLTYRLFTLDSKQVTIDSRIRAGVGYVPYFGLESLPAFGRGQQGAAGLTLPYLAISGTDDPIAPQEVTRTALDRMSGVRGQVLLAGEGHDLEPTTAADIYTWSLGFLSAWVDGNASA